jgi:hypothetical protein
MTSSKHSTAPSAVHMSRRPCSSSSSSKSGTRQSASLVLWT